MDKNHESCGLHFVNIVPVTSDTDSPCTATAHVSEDRSAEVKQEHLPSVKQEADDVCFHVIFSYLP